LARATKAGLVVLLIAIVVVAGIVVHLIQINEAGNQLSFEGVELYNIDVTGSVILIPTKIRIDLGVIVRNPTQYTLDIERMTYTIFIQGKHFGEGSSRDIVVPGGRAVPIPISLEVSVVSVISAVVDALRSGGFEVEVSGIVDVPIKFFGIIKLFTISKPYSVKRLSTWSETPTQPPVTPPSPTVPSYQSARFNGGGQDGRQITVSTGTVVSVYVTLSSSSPISGTVTVEVRRDFAHFQPDDTKTTLTMSATISDSTEVSMGSFGANDYGDNFRSYFIKIYWDGQVIYDPTNPDTREWVKMTQAQPPTTTPPPPPILSYQSARFSGGGQDGRQITVVVGTSVNVYVTLSSSTSTSGTVNVDVRMDRTGLPDDTKTTLTKSATISGSTEIFIGSFTADDYGEGFRSYFIKVYWNDKVIYDPSDPDTREWVKTIQAQPPATPSYQSGRFSGGGQDGRQITVVAGTVVNIYVTLSSSSPTSGTLRVEIWRDLSLQSDTLKTSLTMSVTISGSTVIPIGSFTADDYGGNFRSYFIKVYWNDEVIYDPTDPDTREWVKTTK